GAFTVLHAGSGSVWHASSSAQPAVPTEASGVAQTAVCREIHRSMDESKQAMRDSGVRMHEVPDAGGPEWEALYDPVRESWVADLESIGLPARDVLDDFTAALDRAEAEHGSDRS